MTVLSVLDGIMLEIPVADQLEADQAAAASTQRLASMTVRRAALRHPCAGKGCRHRNHRRDRAHAAHLMDLLELPGDMAVDDDYKTGIVWGSFSKEDVKLLQ